MKNHKLDSMSRITPTTPCIVCGRPINDPIHQIKPVDLNPSDEKLREMIAEKDGQIAQLRKISQSYSAQLSEKDAEIARLKTTDVEQEKANADRHRKQSVPLMTAIAEKDQEIARLKKDTERYQKLRRMLSPDNPGRFDESIDSADECSVKTEYYDPNYVSRPELAKLLFHPLIEVANKDAERYRKLKARLKGDGWDGWSFEIGKDGSFCNSSFDQAVDALPEVQS